ncbi:EamA family transporter [Xylophilus sp. Kf1]|nr:EamA family transporter [Xylophilus sp. Kf1]
MSSPPAVPPTERHPLARRATGIACGAMAGALWGLVFLAPELVGGFGPLHLSAGRYLFYGLLSCALLAPRWRAVVGAVSKRQWWVLCGLALTGNTLYYVLLSAAIQINGIALTSLVIGFLPVAVTLIGSRDTGAVPLARLLPSLVFSALGAVCIGQQALGPSAQGAPGRTLAGLCCAAGALAGWTLFAVWNARCLARFRRFSAHDWNLLTGLMTGAQGLVIAAFALALETSGHSPGEWARLGGVCLGVAVLASLAGNAFWNRMSQLLPLTLVGQMILFETVFALGYGLVWEARWPTVYEGAALGCVIASVIFCLAAHQRQATGKAF